MNCAYCGKPTPEPAYVYEDLAYCSSRHADLWAQREEVQNDPRYHNGRRILHDKGLDEFRRETRRVGCTPTKR